MQKIITFVFIFILVVGVNSLGQIRFLDDIVSPGDEVEMHANIINTGEDKVNDARLTVYIPEIGFFSSFGEYDVKKNKPVGRTMNFDIDDDAELGEHIVRVRTYTDGHWESRYRHIIIV